MTFHDLEGISLMNCMPNKTVITWMPVLLCFGI